MRLRQLHQLFTPIPPPAPNAMAEAKTQSGGRATGVTAERRTHMLATPSPPSGFLCLHHHDSSTSSAVKLLLTPPSRSVSYLLHVLNLHLKKVKTLRI
ncbi:hypothetical protein F2Q69_00030166 [Brassica cretica]|uniref:Uncharacterized protein n=2 Tax=Brassica TaxID=3705 RepID=A0A8S9RYJ6_BRACR|nr:hypothetical protein F2Q69_00030166 [Brassica cretica]